jgi:hypothetical protein
LAAGVGAATLALVIAAAPAAAPESAAGRAGAGPKAGRVDAAAAPKDRTARRRCPPRRARARTARRRARCLRVLRLAAPAPAPERLVPVPAPAPTGDGAPAGGAPGAGPPASGSPALPRFVSVSAREWSLTLSRPLVGAGSVTVELRNVGEDPHNLVVSPDDGSHAPLAEWAETAPGDYLRKAVTLPAGRYLLFCSLEGHEAAGMSARLRVE